MKYILATFILALATQAVFAAPGSHHHASFNRSASGHVIGWIPPGNHLLKARHGTYYYYGGRFYDRRPYGYVSVRTPYGVRVNHLPAGYLTLGIGPSRYFYFAGTWYTQHSNEFEVVEAPLKSAIAEQAANQRLIIYPAQNQSEDQAEQDRYECHRWAFKQTGYEPTMTGSSRAMQPDYSRAMSACLVAKGYVVK